MKKLLLLCLCLILIAALAAGGSYYWLTQIYATTASKKLAQEVVLQIPAGTGSEAIAKQLQEAGVIAHPQAFRLLAIRYGKHTRFQAGEYAFAPGITPLGAIEKLASGNVVRYRLTIPEGKTSAEIVALLLADPVLVGEITQLPAEGSLLPESYDFTRGTTRSQMIARMAAAQQNLVASLWPQRDEDLPLASPQEAVILASIVEKETGLPEERPHIASVYLNRLRQNMPLQADPTVAYGVYGGQSVDQPLTVSDLRADTPYNTYTRRGLTPTPICHAGAAALTAVLHPQASDDLYFVATGKGGHRFAETLAEHNRNVAAYRAWEKQQRFTKP